MDSFYLLAIIASITMEKTYEEHHLCALAYPLETWMQVDYHAKVVFWFLMLLNGLPAEIGLDFGRQYKYICYCARIVILSILVVLLYPFLWVWTIIGTIWFTRSRNCLLAENAKLAYCSWLLFSYCGLVIIGCVFIAKWLTRRQTHQVRAQQGIPVSKFRVLVDLVQVLDGASEGGEMRGTGHDDDVYNPVSYSTPLQARGLPSAHASHVKCIDKWLQSSAKCPRCGCSANLVRRALSNIQTQTDLESPSNVVATTPFVRNQPHRNAFQSRGKKGQNMEIVQVVVDESAPPRL